jgi:hypothetical protein
MSSEYSNMLHLDYNDILIKYGMDIHNIKVGESYIKIQRDKAITDLGKCLHNETIEYPNYHNDFCSVVELLFEKASEKIYYTYPTKENTDILPK